MFESLNDAAKHVSCLAPGETKVFYRITRPLSSFMLPKGYPDLEKDFMLLGTVAGTSCEELFCALQGDNWDPDCEGQALLRTLGIRHTSFSVGDAIQIGDTVHVCAPCGWDTYELVSVR